MCSKTLLVALLLLAATQNAAIMPSLRNRNDFYNDSRNDPSGVTAATVAAAAAAAAATTWRASSINHTDNSGSQNASNHISLQSLRSLRAGRSDASQQSLVSLEKFCARTLLPHVSHRGDSLLRVSANLKAVLPNQLTIDELNKTLLAEARQLGITINPPGWSSSRSDTTLQHSDANAAQKILTRVWTQAGIVDRDTIAFLERALGFCRSASLATERLPSGFEHHRFCRRVGFVHIPKTVCLAWYLSERLRLLFYSWFRVLRHALVISGWSLAMISSYMLRLPLTAGWKFNHARTLQHFSRLQPTHVAHLQETLHRDASYVLSNGAPNEESPNCSTTGKELCMDAFLYALLRFTQGILPGRLQS
eukprot:INCI17672.4.p1 GENE.INCI17672.4~~INCI17672.4.p1  ORF type:complete len:364 (+),score=34.15 INCI17672.4:356-1447(+)